MFFFAIIFSLAFLQGLPRGRARTEIFMYVDETVLLASVNDVCFRFYYPLSQNDMYDHQA